MNGWTLLVGELTRTMAFNDNHAARHSADESVGAPSALLLTAVLGMILAIMNYSKSLADGFTFLSQVVTAANLPLYILTAVAVLWKPGKRGSPTTRLLLHRRVGGAYSIYVVRRHGHEAFQWRWYWPAGLPLYWYVLRRPDSTGLPEPMP